VQGMRKHLRFDRWTAKRPHPRCNS